MALNEFNWDAIKVKTGATANPVAGANPASITVPAGKKWLLQSFGEIIVCDATVANRYLVISIAKDGTNADTAAAMWSLFAASATGYVYFCIGADNGGTSGGTRQTNALGSIECPAGTVISFTWVNLQGGDDAAAVYYSYKEAPA